MRKREKQTFLLLNHIVGSELKCSVSHADAQTGQILFTQTKNTPVPQKHLEAVLCSVTLLFKLATRYNDERVPVPTSVANYDREPRGY